MVAADLSFRVVISVHPSDPKHPTAHSFREVVIYDCNRGPQPLSELVDPANRPKQGPGSRTSKINHSESVRFSVRDPVLAQGVIIVKWTVGSTQHVGHGAEAHTALRGIADGLLTRLSAEVRAWTAGRILNDVPIIIEVCAVYMHAHAGAAASKPASPSALRQHQTLFNDNWSAAGKTCTHQTHMPDQRAAAAPPTRVAGQIPIQTGLHWVRRQQQQWLLHDKTAMLVDEWAQAQPESVSCFQQQHQGQRADLHTGLAVGGAIAVAARLWQGADAGYGLDVWHQRLQGVLVCDLNAVMCMGLAKGLLSGNSRGAASAATLTPCCLMCSSRSSPSWWWTSTNGAGMLLGPFMAAASAPMTS